MYDELVKRLRNCAELHGECALCLYQGNGCDAMPETPLVQAADAIEERCQQVDKFAEEAARLYAKQPKWIPVMERLPEETNHYLVHIECKCDGELLSKWTQVAWFCKKFYWEHSHGTEFFEETVTHWMPLPKPPKEET